jgi:two-component system, OmpR family, sensor kinase
MKLSTRIAAILFLVVTIATSLVGAFAITQNTSTGITALRKSLERDLQVIDTPKFNLASAVAQLQDESQYTLEIMEIKIGSAPKILSASKKILDGIPPINLVLSSLYTVQNFQGNSLIRSVQISPNDILLLALSTRNVNATFHSDLLTLALFIIAIDIIAAALVFVYFQNDNSLDKVNIELKANQQRMESFVGDASHELRTPVTVIRGYVELLQKDQSADEVKKVRYFDRINHEIARMEGLIRDLLLLARAGAGELKKEEKTKVNITKLLAELVEDFTITSPEHEMLVKIPDQVWLLIDEELITQMISNLLSNIRIHTAPQDRVAITLNQDKEYVYLTIEDGGPGLPEDLYHDNFKIFRRFNVITRNQSTQSGLGLSIVKEIISKHGGEIRARKSQLGGVAFDIVLPK